GTVSLTIGNVYYISVDAYSGNQGTFTLCIDDEVDYDFYEGAITLTTLTNWSSSDAEYTTIGGSPDKNKGSNWNTGTNGNYNRWFKFTATTTTLNITVDIGGTKGTQLRSQIAIWESNGTTEVTSKRYVNTNDDLVIGTVSLTIGNVYYISVDAYSGNQGTFTLCIDDEVDYDFYEGAIELTDLIVWSSPDAEYTTIGGSPDKNKGSNWNTGTNGNYNRWFKFQAIFDTVTISVDIGGTKGTQRRSQLALWSFNGTSELSSVRYASTNDDISLTYGSLTVGDWYYISVDAYSGNQGTFTLDITNVSSTSYYTIANGNWTSSSTWKNANIPGNTVATGKTVYVNHSVTLDHNINHLYGILKIESGGSLSGAKDIKIETSGRMYIDDDISIKKIEVKNNARIISTADITLSDKLKLDGTVRCDASLAVYINKFEVINDAIAVFSDTVSVSSDFKIDGIVTFSGGLNVGCIIENNDVVTSTLSFGGNVRFADKTEIKSSTVTNSGTINAIGELKFIESTSDFTNDGTINADKFGIEGGVADNNGTINVTGDEFIVNDASFTNDGLIDITKKFKNDKTGTFTNNGTVTIHGEGNTSENKGTLTNETNGIITVNGEFTNEVDHGSPGLITNNGTFKFVSDASGYTTFLDEGTLNGTSNFSFTLLLSGGDWHYISPPVSNDSTNSLWGAAVYSYNETTDSWQSHAANEPIQSQKGYDVYYSGNKTVTFKGTFNSGSYSNSFLTYNINGYNFVGNPYPSTIDWNATSGWTKTDLDNAIYIWDPVSQNITSYVDGIGTNGGSRYIPPMQGFFVKCSTPSTLGTLGMTDAIRLHNSSISFRNENSKNIIKLKIESSQGLCDETVVRFDNNSTKYFDGDFDAFKMRSYNFAVPQIYTKSEDAEELSINTL
ncbi:MAG: hypothetical protein U9R42_01245, partial [Bacteroidota bacterium]|nr:hypothetical protein [Bacteroidota bacterium]